MNFTRIRRLIQYLLLLYVLALTDLWSSFSRIWRRQQSQHISEERDINISNRLISLNFAKPVIAAVTLSPSKVKKMIFPQSVPLFQDPDNSEEQNENIDEEGDEILDYLETLFAESSPGPVLLEWATGPRDETTFPKILLSMKSAHKAEADFALNEMVKIIEKVDMDEHKELVASAFDGFVKVCKDNEQHTEQSLANIMNHFPFLYSCAISSDEYKNYGTQMLDFLLQCLKGKEQYRRHALYTATILLERETIPEDEVRNKIVPCFFDLLHSDKVVEEQRNEIATALSRVARQKLDNKWMFDNFIPRYSHLLRDDHVHVKKASISILGHLSHIFGPQFTQEFVVPHIVALLADNNWSIRKIICEIIVEVSHNCPANVRRNILAPRFIHLLRDTSRWVAYQAFQELGPFISTFADSSITGLNINDKGQVVSDFTIPVPERESFEFDTMPEGIYIPKEESNSRYQVFTEEEADDVLGQMTSMLDNWDNSEFRSHSHSNGNSSNASTSVAAKCSSVEDLTSLDYDELNQTIIEDEEGHSRDVYDVERKPSDGCEVTYWSASPNVVDISDDLVAFGASSIMQNMEKLNISQNILEDFSGEVNADTVHTFTETSCDTMSSKSDPEIVDDDPLRDCRGSDENEEQMDTSDGESSSNISEIPQADHVPKDLVDNFLAMVSPQSVQNDADINRYCAHNFPAVAYTLGRDSWPLLKDAFKRLSNEDLRVRMTVASSLHEMGRIIGQEKTDSDLLPIFNQFKDDAPEIRYNILKNLFEFFQCLSEEQRLSMINMLPEIMPVSANSSRNDWRYRHEFVKQCRKLCCLYGNEEINRTISAIALTMANDRIAEVRNEAVLLIVEIIRRLVSEESIKVVQESKESNLPLTANLLKDVITSFAKTQKWSRRLTFTHICQGLLEQKALSQEQFCYFLLAQLFGMTSDKVANVRLGACRVLAHLDHNLSPQPMGGETTPMVKEILKKLSNDNDIDVSREAKLTLKEMSEDKLDVALRGKKIQLKEHAFFNDGNTTSYELKDMSLETTTNEASLLKDNYDVVDMDIDESTDDMNSSEC